jgi:uncharacterized membrane protein
MAEPGDPTGPEAGSDDHDHDAHVGFVSPASLAGRARPAEPQPEQKPEPKPEPVETPASTREPDLFDPPEPLPPVRSDPFVRTAPQAKVPRGSSPGKSGASRVEPAPAPMSLYAVYILILLAVPSLGLSAVLALLAVTGRDGPEEPLAASHFVYQQRTLWSAAVAAVLGGLLVIVNIGVFVLFLLALWILARGAFGVLRLKAGRAIDNPQSWLF